MEQVGETLSKEDQHDLLELHRLRARLEREEMRLDDLEENLEQTQDALQQLSLANEYERIPFRLGNCFFSLNSEMSEELLDAKEEEQSAAGEEVRALVGELRARTSTLRDGLEKRLGKLIKLD